MEISPNAPTKTEIKDAIKSLKNGKAAGPDSLPAESRCQANSEPSSLHYGTLMEQRKYNR